MRTSLLLLCLAALQIGLPPTSAAPALADLSLDSSSNSLVAPTARLETVFEKDTIFEGPVWVGRGGAGYLIFSDVPGDAIDRLSADGSVSALVTHVFRGRDQRDALQSSGPSRFRMIGPNGATVDRQGRIVFCAFGDGQIVRVERDGRRTVLASRFDGKRLNAPNDLVYSSDGSLYFTDSRAAAVRSDGEGVPHKGLYVLKAGRVRLLSKDIDHPNGVALSPDEKHLYVTNTRLKTVLRFDVEGGAVANPTVFVDMSGDPRPGGPDGVKVDGRGIVYSTGPGGVWIMSLDGRRIGTIPTPRPITNLAFGGADSRTLYLTAVGAVYRIRLASPAAAKAGGSSGKYMAVRQN
jgi:gluconolactonase